MAGQCHNCAVLDFGAISNLSLNELRNDSLLASVSELASDIVQSFASSGFIVITGHTIKEDVIADAFKFAGVFFNQLSALKISCISKDKARRGYCEANTENFASLLGISGKPNDLVEKFRVGPTKIDLSDPYYLQKEAKVHFFENIWPAEIDQLEVSVCRYYDALADFSLKLLALLEIGLGLPNGYFSSKLDKHTSILTSNYYQECVLDSRRIDGDSLVYVSAHTDVSMMTVVSQIPGSNIGLEIFGRDGVWRRAPCIDNSLVINIGDCLQDWTGGQLVSTLHRVAAPLLKSEGSAGCNTRLSFAYFVSPNYDTLLEIPPHLQGGATEQLQCAESYSNWRKNRIKRAMQALNSIKST